MAAYPKSFLSPAELVDKLQAKGMTVSSPPNAEKTIREIGYYRLKGYFFFKMDTVAGTYFPGTNFEDAVSRYKFDVDFSSLLFSYLLKIEVSIRARLIEAFRSTNDVLVLNDPSLFKDKRDYWDNASSIASEIKRSGDEFIKHNFNVHDGVIPLWATVEVLSFGTLSKVIKNMKHNPGQPFSLLVKDYKFLNSHGAMTTPSQDMFASWTYATSMLRNVCAHGGRLYHRKLSIRPQILERDAFTAVTEESNIFDAILAMKYLRPDQDSWTSFSNELKSLIALYSAVIDVSDLNFPTDWEHHI